MKTLKLPTNKLMLWTRTDCRDMTCATLQLTMGDVVALRTTAPSRHYYSYKVQNYSFIKEENHPMRWL